jgi:hypothetical protein
MVPVVAPLLKMLGSGVGLLAGAARSDPGIEHASFAELLERAGRGALRAGEPVKLDPASGVTLSEDQLARVSEAAGRLEASGASRGLILVDDMALEFDVLTRTITGRVDLGDAGAVVNIDGVVRAAASEDGASPAALTPPSLSMNASLLRVLAGMEDRASAG